MRRCESVADGDGRKTPLSKGKAQRVVALAVARPKTAAVDAQYDRERSTRVLRASEVELHPSAARVCIRDVPFEGDRVRDHRFNSPGRNEGQTVDKDGEHGRKTRHHKGKGVNRVDRLEE